MPAAPSSPPPPDAAAKKAAKALSAPQKALRKLGLVRDMDLALHLPLRYEDETHITRLRDAREGDEVQIEGVVRHQEVAASGRRQLLVTLDDGSGTCLLRFFNFYPSLMKQMAVGARLRVRGQLRSGLAGPVMLHPAVRAAGAPLPERLTPVYPATAALAQAYLRKAVQSGLARADASGQLGETVPPDLAAGMFAGLKGAAGVHPQSPPPTLREALFFLHQPPPDAPLAALQERVHPAWLRLKAEELLAQQLSQWRARQERAALAAPALHVRPDGLHEKLLAALPFALTAAQRRVSEEIARDLARPQPMHRLLQGDVGAGKTVVAALAACVAMDSGWQCALMAPTEILASQHFDKLTQWLAPLLQARGQRVAWLTGSQKKKERAAALQAIESGEAALVVGTHAVIQQQVNFARLGLAVIDEQHRFGVAQRLALRQKLAGQEPHLLMMSATPIPRTLAMSCYADLDVSTLDELPPGRTPVLTKLIASHRRGEVIERLRQQLRRGAQAYWVCPLIEESEALDLQSATQTHAELAAALPGLNVGLLHSRMPAADKKAVMDAFASGQMAALVSTTVIEVGVDVPNASLMVIEHAERFGLSQLHQLRGRVGRGSAASACVLLYEVPEGGRLGEVARERLKAMLETHDGFEIARRDLALRGPGEFLGERQSGAALLRFADLQQDEPLIEWARQAAPQMLARYPALAGQHVQRWLGARMDYLKA